MAVDVLEVKLGISGDQAVVSGLNRVRKAEDDAVHGTDSLTKAMGAMEIPALRAISVAQGLAATVMGLGVAAVAFSGVKLAAEYERVELGFASLLKSASAAHELMANISKLGQSTPFRTQELTQFAQQLLATDASANKALNTMRILRTVTDAMAAGGRSTADVGDVSAILGNMRIAPHIDTRQIQELFARGVNIPEVYKAATGQNVAPQIAMARLGNMQGQRAFDLIMKGMEKLYGGAAASQAATGLGLLQNIIETLGLVALPTGVILLGMLKPLGSFLLNILNLAQGLNEMSHGVLGLIVIIALIVRGWNFLSSVAIAAYTATQQLTTALLEYAAAARVAATSTTTAAGAQTAAAGGAAVSGAAAVGGGAVGAAGNAGAMAKMMGALKAAGPAIVGLALSLLGGELQKSKSNNYKNTGDYMVGIGSGIGIASIVGIFLPLPAKIAVAVAGGIIGGLKTWWDKSHPEKAVGDNTQQRQLQVLKDIHSQLIGGGDRSQRVKSEIEAEFSLRKAVFSGVG